MLHRCRIWTNFWANRTQSCNIANRPFSQAPRLNVRLNSTHIKMEAHEEAPITARPAEGQLIGHESKTYTTVREGKAYILVPPKARTSVNPNAKAKADEEQKVFYNPIQQFNRDLSVLAIRAYGEHICCRKTSAREVKKKKDQGKKDRKRAKRAEENGNENGAEQVGANLVGDASEEGAEAAKVDQNDQAKKRKRANEDDEKSEDRARKVQKGGDINGDQETAVAEAPAEGASSGISNGGVISAANGLSNDEASAPLVPNAQSTAIGLDKHADQHTSDGTIKPPDPEVKPWQPSFRILDALSATGLRALRYATEIPNATAIVANDRDKQATAAITLNVQHNDLSSKISTSTGDAMGHMYAAAFPPPHSHGPNHNSGKYDVIDLDPYGTAAPFIDAALQALNDEGLLCVTCTDSGVFASCGYSEKTFSLYGGMPIKSAHAHEGGLRLILHSIAASAAKYSLAIEPLLSLSIDFYARLFIRVRKSPADVKFLAGKTMLVYECDVGCGAWSTQYLGRHQRHGKDESNWKYHISVAPTSDRLCEHCGSKMHIAGPMWGGPLHNAAFVERVLDDADKADGEVYHTLPRIQGMLDTALNELLVNPESFQLPVPTTGEADSDNRSTALIPATPPHLHDSHPFYFLPSALCKVIKAVAPPETAIKGALRRLGYVVTRSHAKAGSLKTDAPWSVVWEVMREWVRQRSPVQLNNLREGGPGWRILEKTKEAPPTGDEVRGEDAATGVVADGTATGNDAANAETPDITTDANNASSEPPAKPPQPEPGKPLDVSKLEIVFDEKLGKDKERPGKKRLVRYQQNPRENWGPMARAKGKA